MIHHKVNQPQSTKIPRTIEQRRSLPHNSKNAQKSVVNDVYARLFSSAVDATIILTAGLQIQYVNSAAKSLFNFSAEEGKGKFFKDYLPAQSLHKFTAAIKKSRQDATQARLEIDVINGYRQRIAIALTILPMIEHKKVSGFCLTLHDIGQEQQIEELLRESQKMEAMQYFVAGTTKELQHPLLAILKRIESIESKYKDRSFEYVSYKEFNNIMTFLGLIRKQIKACYDTTTKLTSANKKRLKFESNHCQVNEVIREIIRIKGKSFKNTNIKFRARLSEKLPLLALGHIEINQILSHIIDNSFYAMPGGGVLTVTTQSDPVAHKIQIDISDDGVGISPEDLPHIFEPFFTTKQRVADKSAGLGLSIVYSLVKAGNGQIKVKSSLRKGTKVQLIFPVVEPSK
ncbi:MAG: PAS domain-containing protein [Candidatus Omnitrophica bacterium]|nr:PAS domain-containing protein [Candidatus Omnitrophota bacterium]